LVTTDAREHWREYDKSQPYFGTALAALLDGLILWPEAVEAHVVTCTQRPMTSPEKLAPNVWFHSLLVPKIGWLRSGYQGCIRAVRKKLQELRLDLVHGQGTERECAISAVFSGLANVVTVHGNMRLIAKVNRARPFTYQWLAARLERFTLPRADGVVCISRYTQEAVSDLARKTWIVPNAVDASFFDVVRKPSPPPTVLCVGHVTVRKNQIEFIRALEPLAARQPLRVLFLGGVVPEDAYCAQFLQMLQTRPWCVYGGVADRTQLKAHLSEAALLALPSLEDNCPMVVLEAMAAGVPVVAARVGGVPELIEEGVTGLLCDPTDPTTMGAAVRAVLDYPEQALARSVAAQEHTRARLHPREIARRHLEIYAEVSGKPSAE
jgi:glycosyltransferase involved in cell wall biosynthesis